MKQEASNPHTPEITALQNKHRTIIVNEYNKRTGSQVIIKTYCLKRSVQKHLTKMAMK